MFSHLTLNAQTLSVATGVVLPLLVALVTKVNASPAVKSFINAALSAIAGVVAASATNGTPLKASSAVGAAILTFVVSGAAHRSLWLPTGVTDVVNQLAPEFGFGTNPAPGQTKSVEDIVAGAVNNALRTLVPAHLQAAMNSYADQVLAAIKKQNPPAVVPEPPAATPMPAAPAPAAVAPVPEPAPVPAPPAPEPAPPAPPMTFSLPPNAQVVQNPDGTWSISIPSNVSTASTGAQ